MAAGFGPWEARRHRTGRWGLPPPPLGREKVLRHELGKEKGPNRINTPGGRTHKRIRPTIPTDAEGPLRALATSRGCSASSAFRPARPGGSTRGVLDHGERGARQCLPQDRAVAWRRELAE
ncbi:hypothetical protein NDU88_001420 [Pleurodeles waltl]|uniref:Uncharacterized protein n=1 Tax=Pleurodeles waltl TaxID=8319 RepID=A0AAV7V8D2_PLEWA|nr:hypothetical protein NDU88_001420 [Pleurodeles waltl]